MKNPKYTYKITKRGKDTGDHEIEKVGVAANFTLRELHGLIKDAEAQTGQIEGGVKGVKVVVNNIRHHHPDIMKIVSGLSRKKKFILLDYAFRLRKLKEYEDALKEAKSIEKKLKDENAHVRKVLKLDPPAIKNPAVSKKK